ncbi:membrane-associated kinase regulator [Parasponia andersonii]|uniref:Membrane-associated kinase regulator n=1 Tax=Parasponia andersonii TaxID=3476 RepID=A0A2P5AT60_PARAD|nr:membrane-associated kinase regulator [Parasponia andersonii]
METRRKRSSSGEAFSFPSTPIHDSSDDFEFGCLTPDSPSTDPSKNSPADHLFFNGRLLPHSFPFRPANCGGGVASESCRSTSRTSSISSKDSLVSSRSNSTNSRSSSSSCSSSARTSSSDNSERRLLYRHQGTSIMGRDRRSTSATTGSSKAVSAQVYGSSQRWQFMAPVPALSRETSLRRRNTNDRELRALPKKKDRTAVVRRPRLGRRLFRWFLAACKECHAIEPSKKDKVLRGNVKILQ